ncbi:hypothetical protein NONI108955_36395 [Nocardia ninae]|uniref:Uncharacterized protein n=1 Tax=Nocardia ninae NBRC 108245 TaxID=1210091 RepID=A0A511MFR0_9NOCA|nr:hypothetical protein [Nocardia ninae]GEM39515.1 hypothetical protein NN4_40340 [Nocardia ninae NBRC 108245]
MSNTSTPGVDGSPPGYRWFYVWPETRGMGPLLIAAPLILLGIGSLIYIVTTGDTELLTFALFSAIIAGFGIVVIAGTKAQDQPIVESGDDTRVFALRYPFFTVRHGFATACLVALFSTMVWIGITDHQPWMIVAGSVLFPITAIGAVLPAFRYALHGRLAFGPKTLRVSTYRCDWEFPWDAIVAAEAVLDAPDAAIAIHCPRAEMIDRPTSSKPLSRWIPPDNAINGPWQIISPMWGVNGNSLLSTIRHLQAHPEHRDQLTKEQLTAMLTPPPWSVRDQLRGQS